MRELTVKIRFTAVSLGNTKLTDGSGRFVFSRSPTGHILFLAKWYYANLHFASQLMGKHQDEVRKIRWDANLDGGVHEVRWYPVYYKATKGQRLRYTSHEALFPGQVVGIHCAVPSAISDADFRWLMNKAGKYRGLSPWKPGEYGFYVVEDILPRYTLAVEAEEYRVEVTK